MSTEPGDFRAALLEDARKVFLQYKTLADKAVAQIDDASLFRAPDAESNSIAVIMKHIAGNLRSRFTDFLTSDGEKPDRKRDGEFEVAEGTTRAEILAIWEKGWETLFQTLLSLRAEDLSRTVMIRSEPHTVMMALNRQLSHYPYHVGQIVYLARHFRGPGWQSLSVPRGQSEQFNQEMRRKMEEARKK